MEGDVEGDIEAGREATWVADGDAMLLTAAWQPATRMTRRNSETRRGLIIWEV